MNREDRIADLTVGADLQMKVILTEIQCLLSGRLVTGSAAYLAMIREVQRHLRKVRSDIEDVNYALDCNA